MKVQTVGHSMEMDDCEILYCVGLDDAFVGLSMRFNDGPLATYDINKIIGILMERDGMDEDDAREFYEVNILGAWVGDRTPIFITLIEGGSNGIACQWHQSSDGITDAMDTTTGRGPT